MRGRTRGNPSSWLELMASKTDQSDPTVHGTCITLLKNQSPKRGSLSGLMWTLCPPCFAIGRFDQQFHQASSNGEDIIPLKGARVLVAEEKVKTPQGKNPCQSHQTSLFWIYQINFYFEPHPIRQVGNCMSFLRDSPCTGILLPFQSFLHHQSLRQGHMDSTLLST